MNAPRDDAEAAKREHEDRLLDEALEDLFPASDPPSIARPRDLGDPPVGPAARR